MQDTEDSKSELLRTQAIQACLTAMGASEVRVYGNDPLQWGGTILLSNSEMVTTVFLSDREGNRYRYETFVRVEVIRTRAELGNEN